MLPVNIDLHLIFNGFECVPTENKQRDKTLLTASHCMLVKRHLSCHFWQWNRLVPLWRDRVSQVPSGAVFNWTQTAIQLDRDSFQAEVQHLREKRLHAELGSIKTKSMLKENYYFIVSGQNSLIVFNCIEIPFPISLIPAKNIYADILHDTSISLCVNIDGVQVCLFF